MTPDGTTEIRPLFCLSPAIPAFPPQDWQLPLGRRFRALKLWFVLRTYGAAGLRDYIGHKAGLASHFADLVRGDARFELTAPPRFGLVCFRAKVCDTS